MSTITSTQKYKCTIVLDTCGLFPDTRGVTVDDVGGFVYWADYKTIKQASSLDGSNEKNILVTGKLSVTCKVIH